MHNYFLEKAGKIYIYEAGIQLNAPLTWQCENALDQLSQDHHEVHLFYSSSKIEIFIITMAFLSH